MTTHASMTATTAAPGLCDLYEPADISFDEMRGADGSLRPHWRRFVEQMDQLGPAQIKSRWEYARRLIRENGITHNVYGDPNGLERPWNLDLLPLLLPAAQWKRVEAALVQRARLLNALLADLYGPASVITQGLLPPALLYANSGFLRPVHAWSPPDGRWLHLYAADLVRVGDGQFQVLSDRTQAPSGSGYALENRIVLNRVLPTVFGSCNVQRLAPFFIAMRKTLACLKTGSGDQPRVILLTPGPYNETYFEHAYLARYLGYSLVQGSDLTVRDCRVYLKTLGGLQRVDVILRRVDDHFCDPLELYRESFLGVPGLLQAVREGTVCIANAIGSGVLQAPGFLPFLPALCRHLLGEDLAMESVRTWWCGDEKSLRYVLENVSQLVIKPAYPTIGADPVFGEELSQDQQQELVAKLRARPEEYVAQENVSAHTAPVLLGEKVESRVFVARAFLTASDGSYVAMHGALTRVTASPQSQIVSLQKGGGSKDTWILADGPVNDVTLLATTSRPLALSRGGGDLPSRVADDLFWLGRYVERADALVRLARVTLNRLSDPNELDQGRSSATLGRELLRGWAPPKPGPNAARELAAMLLSPADPSGLRLATSRARELARVLRDRISSDVWRVLQCLERDAAEPINDDDDPFPAVMERLSGLVVGLLAFAGMAAESMTRGHGWRFLDLGLRLERGLSIIYLLRATLLFPGEDEGALLESVLEIADSSLTYRRRYLTRLEASAIADLLLADETNPRAAAYQVAAIDSHLSALPRELTHPQRSPDCQSALKLRALLRLTDLSAACQAESGRRSGLQTLLREVNVELSALSDWIGRSYFSHALTLSPLRSSSEAGS